MNKKYLLCVLIVSVCLTACGNNDTSLGNGTKHFRFMRSDIEQQRLDNHAKLKLLTKLNGQTLGEVERKEFDEVIYVPAVEILQRSDFHVEDAKGVIRAGFSDAFIELKKDSKYAIVDGQRLRLPFPLRAIENQQWIAVPNLKVLFGENSRVWTPKGKLLLKTDQDYKRYGFPGESLDDLVLTQTANPFEGDFGTLNTQAKNILLEAKKWLDTPYQFNAPEGGTKAFDSSSFVQYVFAKNNVELPRHLRNQAKLGELVPVTALEPGDLLFFAWPGGAKANPLVAHVGIYAGNGYMIHASSIPEERVQVENLADPQSIYKGMYIGAKRIQ